MEFFELFKTPWEPAVRGKRYDVVLSADDNADTFDAALALVYGARELPIDRRCRAEVDAIDEPRDIKWGQETFPVYAGAVSFSGPLSYGNFTAGAAAVDYVHVSGTTTIRRVGYDLFEEISHLLTIGQPKTHAETPTLELHIEAIRQSLQQAGISFVEIPPRPFDAAFTCCLTHDIDFCGISRHGIDGTVAGFALRGTVGTLIDVVRGRRPIDEALRNWLAVLSLPLVWLGLKRDFWDPFHDYSRAEHGRKSTFFVIPFKGIAGASPDGNVRPRRAAPYAIHDIRRDIETGWRGGAEFAVHGIDAWRDVDAGRREREELTGVTGQRTCGTRMHWLYFSEQSPQKLEDAGYAYDSTCGYNDAIGYRAGTPQVFQLPGTKNLMELPLSIMDSALFYPDRMGLDRPEAMARCRAIVRVARRFGGTLVVNWHDRSLAPERQWGRCYEDLLSQIGTGVWFATAGEAVDWFRWRRSIRFTVPEGSRDVHIDAPSVDPSLPPARLALTRSVASEIAVKETRFTGGLETVCL